MTTQDGLDGVKTAKGGRDRGGRFAQGNTGGPGRPPRPAELHYLRAISDACPLETWQEIVTKAVDLAKEGDVQARAWLSKYLCGDSSLRDSLPVPSTHELIAQGFGGYDPLA